MTRQVVRALVVSVVWSLAVVGLVVAYPGPSATASAPISATVTAELASKSSATAWVALKAHAELSPAFGISDWNARGKFVYDALTSVANRSQAGLLHFLAAKGVEVQPFWVWNVVRVKADASTFKAIAARSEVDRILADQTYQLSPTTPGSVDASIQTIEWGVDRVNAPQVWSVYGDHGEGIVVATIDTGVMYNHAAVVNQYRGNLGGGSFDHNYNWWDPSQTCGALPPFIPCDNNGHGTHTMGTIVGDDGLVNQVGVAPAARWIAAKGCESSSCSTTSLLSSGQFMVAPTDLAGANPNSNLRPNLVSNSWGGGGNDPWYQATVNAWVAAGIFPVFANGNAGPGCGSVGAPGEYMNSYGVGAFDRNNAIAAFSSRGPAASGEIKPNISGPGVDVRSSYNNGGYTNLSGTSMATPHVAGVVALLLSGSPTLVGNIATVRSLLDATAIDVNDVSCGGSTADNNVWGEGRIDALAALDAAPGVRGTLTGTVTDAGTSAPLVGATVAITGGASRTTTTNALGVYTLKLPVGTYDVTVSRFGYVSSSSIGVPISDGVTTTRNFALTALPTHSVSGTVRDNASTPLGGTSVIITNTPLAPATTNGLGQYSFAAVPVGSYTVVATPASHCLSNASRSLTVSGANVPGFDFALAQKQDAFGYRCLVEATAFVAGIVPVTFANADDASTPVALPFAFGFYGSTFTTANVSTNGLVSFGDTSTAWSNTAIPNIGQPNGAVFAYWDDLYVDSPTADVFTASLGAAPNRRFVIEWRNVRYFGDAGRRVGFEIILNENGDIQAMYTDIAGGDGLEMGNSATVGIENPAGSVALQYASNEAVLSAGLAIRYFIPPGGGNLAPIAVDDLPSTNEDTAVILNVVGNDSDPNGDPIAVASVTQPAAGQGTVVLNPDSTVTYTPPLNYNGLASFTYVATDGLLSDTGAVTVSVNPVNDAPTIAVVVLAGTSACNNASTTIPAGTIALLVGDVDTALNSLVFTTASSTQKVLANASIAPIGGSGANRSLSATGTGAKGNSTITVTASDGSLSSSIQVRFSAGTAGNTTLNGTAGPDMLFGLAGNDTLRGIAAVDLLCGGAGTDSLTGGSEADWFSGGTGIDTNVDFGAGDLGDGS